MPPRDVLLRQLYQLHAAWIYALVFHIVRDSQAAQNLVNEAFWRMWNEPRMVDIPTRSTDAWVRVLARNLATEYLRTPQSDGVVSYPRTFIADQIADQQLSFNDLSSIHLAIERLPPDQRTVLEFAHFHNMSYTDIADIVGRPLGTVKTWGRSAHFRLSRMASSSGNSASL